MKTEFPCSQVILASLEYITDLMYLEIVILVCSVFLKVKYLMPLHFSDTKTFKLQDKGWEMTCL